MTKVEQVVVYTTTWCGFCRRLMRQLDEAGIPYRAVDVDAHPDHGERIVAATGGYRTVPTVEIRGRLLVNPTLEEVRTALEGASATPGYRAGADSPTRRA